MEPDLPKRRDDNEVRGASACDPDPPRYGSGASPTGTILRARRPTTGSIRSGGTGTRHRRCAL